MYQKKNENTDVHGFGLDCLCIIASLILVNYIRNGRLFDSDNARMNLGLMMGACLTVFLGMNLLRSSNRDIILRGFLHEIVHIVRSNAFMLAGASGR